MRDPWSLSVFDRNLCRSPVFRVIPLLVFLVTTLSPGLTAFSQPPSASQTANFLEGLKLIAEGQRLADLGTRSALAEALDKYKEAFALFKKDGLKEGMGLALFASGAAHSLLGQKRRALDDFSQALSYLKETGDSTLFAMALTSIGMAYLDLSESHKALDYLQQALSLLGADDNQIRPGVLCTLGAAYVKLGQKQKSFEYLDEALKLSRETGDKQQEVNALLLISAALSSLGQKRKALASAEAALQIAKERKDSSSQATCLISLGEIHSSLGDSRKALSDYDEAIRLARQSNSSGGEATALNNKGLIYRDLGDTDTALALYQEAIRIHETEGEPEESGVPLNGIGDIYDLRAEPLKALSCYQKALAFARAVNHQGREASTLINIAHVYYSFGQHEQALKANSDAVNAFRAIEDPGGEATALSNMGAIYNKLGRQREAQDCLNRALELQRRSEDRYGQARTLAAIGDGFRAAGDLTKAIDAYNEALALMETTGDRIGTALVANTLGFTYDSRGEYEKALGFYLRALPWARSAGDLRGEATVLSNLGFLREKHGDLKEAEELYQQAIEARERVRTGARLEEFKTEIADESAELYSRTILLKMKVGKSNDAFELSERARARSFLDQLNNARFDFRKGADPELVAKEQSLRFEIRSLEEKLRKERLNDPASEGVAIITAELNQKRDAYAALLIRLKASNPDYAQLQSSAVTPLSEIQKLLGPQTTLISYFVASEKTFAFVVGSGSFKAVEIPVKEADLRAAINWFRGFPNLRDPETESLKQLHDWLIAPIRPYIKTPGVTIAPHGVLHYVPFAALTDGRRYFGEEHVTCYLPSASILASLRGRSRSTAGPILPIAQARTDGLPMLRYVDEEVEAISKLYGAQAFSSGRTTKSEFLKRASSSSVIHIAAHAELNARKPLFSRIRLAPEKDGDSGALEVREIYGVELPKASLVVLSACNTHLGALSKGDDVIGLNRALIYAGAPTVIASLWSVDDESTSLLMKSFYTHLKQGMSKAEALHAAQAEIRTKYPQYAHPYYWAGFVLTGDPGLSKIDRGSRR